MSKKYAVIDKETLIVENVVLWDGVTNWNPGNQYLLIEVEGINPMGSGMKYEDGNFIFINGEDVPEE